MTKRQKWLTAALVWGLTGVAKAVSVITGDGVDNAPQSSAVALVAAWEKERYRRCLDGPLGHIKHACDLYVFGEIITEDDPLGRWLCDLMGNRQCTAVSISTSSPEEAA